MSHFKILIQHYLRCLLRIAVTARCASTRLSDCTPLLHVIYECMRGGLFFIAKTLSLEAAVKEEWELSPWNNWPSSRKEPRTVGKGREKGSTALRIERLEGRQQNASARACDPARRRLFPLSG